MKGKKILALILTVALVITILPVEKVAAKSLTFENVSGTKKTMYIGSCFLLETNTGTSKLIFLSNNKKVVTVNDEGLLTAKAKGTAAVTVKNTSTRKTKVLKVTVKKATMYTTSKRTGSFTDSMDVKLTAKTGYKLYFTTTGTYSVRKVIKSGRSKTFSISKTTMLSVYPMKSTSKTTTKKLNNTKDTNQNCADYLYTMVADTESNPTPQPTLVPTIAPTPTQTPAATTIPTATPIVTQAPTVVPSPDVTLHPTEVPSGTSTPAPTDIPSGTSTPTPTETPSGTSTPAPTATPNVVQTPEPDVNGDPEDTTAAYYVEPTKKSISNEDTDASYNSETAEKIVFNSDNTISYTGSGATVSGTTITITQAGTFEVSGSLQNGQILLNAASATVRLILNGVTMTNDTSAPIYAKKNTSKTIITLKEGTVNTLSDAETYVYAEGEDEPDAAIFCKKDLVINGSGTLNVTGKSQNGIKSKANLCIAEGVVTVDAVNNGISGKDSLTILGGTIDVTAGGDCLKATNDDYLDLGDDTPIDNTVGYVDIEGGTITLNGNEDGIDAVSTLYASPEYLNITTTKPAGTATTEVHFKGLKAGTTVQIADGNITMNVANDGVNSGGCVLVSGGTTTIQSGDDGMHGDIAYRMTGGIVDITKSYEGLEGADMYISGGSASVVATDDGINVNGGGDSTGTTDPFNSVSSAASFQMKGGTINVNAAGDGVDVNGSFYMSGGNVYVSGPTDNGNAALDYDGEFELTGGKLVAAGSSGMAQAPSNTSTQPAIQITFTSQKTAGTLVQVKNANGDVILEYSPIKAFNSIVLSCSDMVLGGQYSVYVGGTLYKTFTMTSVNMTDGTSGSGGQPGRW